MGNIDAASMKAVLMARAEEIASVAASAPPDALLLDVVNDDGTWQGCRVVPTGAVRPEAERKESEGFYLLASDCRTPEQVRQFISQALGDVEDEED